MLLTFVSPAVALVPLPKTRLIVVIPICLGVTARYVHAVSYPRLHLIVIVQLHSVGEHLRS